jgi:glycosyltransferase involved in cell wall biosynthesis/SAM-dependent methyltransferase
MSSVSKFDIQYDFTHAARVCSQSNALKARSGSEMLKAFESAAAGQWDQAANRFADAADMDGPSNFNAHLHAGLCFLKNNHILQALSAFEKAESLEPENFALHLYSGIAYHLLGLTGRANIHWWTASQIESNDTIKAIIRNFFTIDQHPERLSLYPICNGKGIDVGCGNYKTHQAAIGIDLIPGGELGKVGSVAGRASRADLTASGDALCIKTQSLDYVIARHNLEHYVDLIKALQEWHRVLKPGGLLGIIVPDERYVDTIRLDPTHKHVFTPSSLQRILDLMNCFDIIHLDTLLYHWSFVCVAQKRPISESNRYRYADDVAAFEIGQVKQRTDAYRTQGSVLMADQCEQYARILGAKMDSGLKVEKSSVASPSLHNPSNVPNQKAAVAVSDLFKPETGVNPFYLGLVQGDGYGWGVCSRYLIRELSKIRPVAVLNPDDGSDENGALPGMLFQALVNVDLDPMFPKARGERNVGYTFFENELTDRSKQNAQWYDRVLGGSTWCKERMLEKGITHCDVLIQGIDPNIFYPIQESLNPDRFVIFSGGKFELRKGQDLVLKAVKIMQDKYPDVWLVNCWYNLWPASTRLMGYSPHIRFQHHDNEPWPATMQRTYQDNGLDGTRIITHELVPQESQLALYAATDVGLFPNRCEGGTNLVLMEYMACGKPVIVSNASGHKDIVNDRNALLLNHLSRFNVTDAHNRLIGRWLEPSLDEIVSRLEYAYHHRTDLRQYAKQAGEDLKQFTWGHSARQLLKIMEG